MTCYIDKRNYDIEMSYDMLYRHEKTIVRIEQLDLNHFPCYSQTACQHFLLDGLRVQFKMYSRLCPWLLTWSDYGEDYSEGDDGYDGAGAN
jgi:hypothetical protein